MKKRWIAVLLCAALLAAFGWGQPRISGEGETYDLYFLEADLSDAPGGDALRAEPLYIESGEVFDIAGVRRAVREAFDTYPDMDAFVGADLAAAFAVQEAVSRSIAVPGDVQIIAYDGTLAADCAGMPLTTVAQDFRQIAHTIAACVEHGIESSPQRPDATDGDANMTIIPVTLHERATTRR